MNGLQVQDNLLNEKECRVALALSDCQRRALIKDVQGMQKEIWDVVDSSRVNKTRTVREYVNAQSENGGYFADTKYPIPGTTDDDPTNEKVLRGVRALTLKNIEKNPSKEPGRSAVSYLIKPESNDLPQNGYGRGKGDELRDIRNLMITGSYYMSEEKLKEIQLNAERATDSVADQLNGQRPGK